MDFDRLKRYAEMLDSQASENERAANAVLENADYRRHLGEVWMKTRAEELRQRAKSDRDLAVTLRRIVSK